MGRKKIVHSTSLGPSEILFIGGRVQDKPPSGYMQATPRALVIEHLPA